MNILLKKFIQNPLKICTIKASTNSSARKIANLINNTKNNNVIEIGGGTGALTQFVENKDVTIIERDYELSEILKTNYPQYTIKNQCGISYLKEYKNEYGLLASIPLIDKELKTELINCINDHISKNQIKWIVNLGYQYFDPLKGINFKNKKRYITLKSFPLEMIWHYF